MNLIQAASLLASLLSAAAVPVPLRGLATKASDPPTEPPRNRPGGGGDPCPAGFVCESGCCPNGGGCEEGSCSFD
jgi:hypothetical protein